MATRIPAPGWPRHLVIAALSALLCLAATITRADDLQDLREVVAGARLEGTVQARQRAFVTNGVPGVLVGIHFAPGDVVEEGQLLFELSAGSHRHRVSASKAALERRRVELAIATRNRDRAARLLERGTVTETAAQDAEDQLALAEVALAEAQANLDLNAAGLNATRITAPISGLIGAPRYAVGTYLDTEAGQTLAEIIQVDPILISYKQPYELLLGMHTASPTRLREILDRIALKAALPTGETLPQSGTIQYIDSGLDTDGALTIWAEFPNPDAILIPGLQVTLELVID